MASETHLGENPALAQGLCSGNSTPPTKLPTVNTLPKGITVRNKAARSPGHQGRAAPPAVSSSASVHQALQPIGLVPAGPSASSEVGMAVLCRAWRGGQEGRLGRRSCSYGRNHGNPANATAFTRPSLGTRRSRHPQDPEAFPLFRTTVRCQEQSQRAQQVICGGKGTTSGS